MSKDTKDIVLQLAQAAYDKKGMDIAVLDMESLSSVADYFLLVSASNVKQAQSIADAIEEGAEAIGEPILRQEGYRSGEWVLIDLGAVVCHVFVEETREFYGLDELWSDAAIVPFTGK